MLAFENTITCHLAAPIREKADHTVACSCKITFLSNIINEANVQNSFFVTDPLLFILEAVGEDQVFASPFGCCIQEVLLCCYPTLSEEGIAARLGLAQRLETTLQILSTATDGTGQHGGNHRCNIYFVLVVTC